MCKKNGLFSVRFFKKGFLCLLLLFYSFSGFSVSLKQWKELRSYKDNLILSLKKNPSVYASVTRSQGIHPKGFNSKSFSFKALEEGKQKMLSFIQIQDWKASSYQWKPMKDKGELYIKGSYLNYKNIKHDFQEFHIYSPESVLQVLVSAPSLEELESSKPEDLFQLIREGRIKLLSE